MFKIKIYLFYLFFLNTTILLGFLLDDFYPIGNYNSSNKNDLGEYTDDDGVCLQDRATNNYLKISWDDSGDYWYSVINNATGRDISSLDYISFRIRATVANKKFNVRLRDKSGTIEDENITNYITLQTYWQTVQIPLSNYTVVDLTQIQSFQFLFNVAGNSSGTIYVDDINFYKNGNNPPSSITVVEFWDNADLSLFLQQKLVSGTKIYVKCIGTDVDKDTFDTTSANIKSSISDPVGFTITLHETESSSGTYIGYFYTGNSTVISQTQLGAQYINENIIVNSVTDNSKSDSYQIANTPLCLDNFDDGSDPNFADGITVVYSGGSGTASFSYDNTVPDHTLHSTAGYSIKFNYNTAGAGDYAGVQFYTSGMNLSIYNNLTFWIKGASGSENIHVQLKDMDNNKQALSLSSYLSGGITTSWKKAVISLGDFSKINFIRGISDLSFNVKDINESSSVYIDDIAFDTTRVTSINFMTNDWSSPLGNNTDVDIGERLYIRLSSTSVNTNSWDNTYVRIKSTKDPIGITVNLFETGRNTGIYTNTVIVSNFSSQSQNKIGVNSGDVIRVYSTCYTNYWDEIKVRLPNPNLIIFKSVSNIQLNGVDSKPIPGASIMYKIICSNSGHGDGVNIIVYDKLPGFVKYEVGSTQYDSSWTNEFSTNSVPSQSYNSTNYNLTESGKIKWIRWRRKLLISGEKVTFIYRVMIK